MPHPAYCDRIDAKRSKAIYADIYKALKKEKLYRDPNFTAQHLANLLHINTRYIAAVVQVNTNENFSTLLNSIRLAEAERMLRNHSQYSTEEIGLMSGFGSRQSFHRVFLKHYGMTPRKFRLKHKEENSEE